MTTISFKDTINHLKQNLIPAKTQQKKVVILGAGPAGLIRAIPSLLHGNQTVVLEKRAEGANGRSNTVALTEDTIKILKKYGIYQYLIENKLIYSPNKCGYISVRLEDLEKAMKAVIGELSKEKIIHYETTVKAIKADGSIITNGQEEINQIDTLVNAEGANSSTNKLLGINRIEALPKVPVLAVIFKDDRPKITGPCTLVKYMGKTLIHTATSIYYYAIFIFKLIFQREHVFNANRKIAGALILKTPAQSYLGFGFNKTESEKLRTLSNAVEQAKVALNENKNQDTQVVATLEKALKNAEKKLNSHIKHWAGVAFCAANTIWFLRLILDRTKTNFFNFGSRLPLHSFTITEIGADKAEKTNATLGNTAILLSGDALATVDPTTGLGCNTAIGTSDYFDEFLTEREKGTSLANCIEVYARECSEKISKIHSESQISRSHYRPDAL